LRALGWLLLTVYVVLGLGVLSVRYWVLPNLQAWRVDIARHVSDAIGARIQFGQLQAQWTSLNPRIQLDDVELFNQQGQRVLSVPQVRAELSWRSLLSMSPQFVSLRVENVELDVSRDAQGTLHLLGQSLDLEGSGALPDTSSSGFIAWLLQQQRILLTNARLRWHDQQTFQPPFELNQVSLDISRSGNVHRMALSAVPPVTAGQKLDIRLELTLPGTASGLISLQASHGRAYIDITGLRPQGWSGLLPTADYAVGGDIAATAWLTLKDGAPEQVAARFRLQDGRWSDAFAQAHVQSFDAFVYGHWSQVHRWFDLSRPGARQESGSIAYKVGFGGLRLELPGALDRPVDIDRLTAQGRIDADSSGQLKVQADVLTLANADMQTTLSGSWSEQSGNPAGILDIKGVLHRASVPAIVNYLPHDVDPDARTWMRSGLLDGELLDAGIRLYGDLSYFPFQERPDKGDFLIRGRYTNTTIDFVPARPDSLGWPRLQGMAGQVSLHRADLRMTADTAYMEPSAGERIDFSDLQARIPNVEHQAVLWVGGNSQAQAASYLSLMTHSDLGGLLDNVATQASGAGLWEVPLQLMVPLYDSTGTTVTGRVHFSDAQVVFMPGLPALTNVQGDIEFTENYLKAADLKAQALGGGLSIRGGLGQSLDGLVFEGKAGSSALAGYVGLPVMRRLKGAALYQLTLNRTSQGYKVTASSSLEGLALDLPAPLGKSADTAMPLRVSWGPSDARSRRLSVTLGSNVVLALQRREGRKGSYFQSGSLGVNAHPDLPVSGFVLDIKERFLDLDAWSVVLDDMSGSQSAGHRVQADSVLPALATARVQSDNARFLDMPLEYLTLTAMRTPEQQWRVDVSSSETAGTLFWRQARGKAAGRIDAQFDRLALGQQTEQPSHGAEDSGMQVAENLDIPAINLHVKDLTLYGSKVGELTVMGMNEARGQLWRLDELRVSSPWATFTGSGMWRLRGPQRGLTLDINGDVKDMGAYLEQLGHKDVMSAGAGKVSAKLEWKNMPWAFSRADLNGSLSFNLAKGRFSAVNSHTARLLELLSMQSIKRLAKFDLNPANLTREGFPFDNLGGRISLTNGIMSTRDYRVTGPVATIVLEGDVNLVSETLNLDAVVVPNLDVSGAAVAAGIAINPIIGIGAFLTQWLLQAPLSKAMSVQYHVDGPWDKPRVNEVSLRKPGPGVAPDTGTAN
jgi:uncharacterized protein (TIGR02099 family)